jgi:hypothetical protein
VLFYRSIVDVCYKKCIVPKFHDPAMAVGEKSCTERCVAKYIQVRLRRDTPPLALLQPSLGCRKAD